jgi:hypothetical protein
MKHRIAIWGLAGFLIAAGWAIVSWAVPLSTQPIALSLARFSCPIVLVGFSLHFGVPLAWVLIANVVTYALAGLVVETLWRLGSWVNSHQEPIS